MSTIPTNNNKLTRININNNDDKKILNFSSKGFIPKTKEEFLALDLAEELNDRKNLSLYLHYAKKYPESFLRRVSGEVKEIPAERIKNQRPPYSPTLLKNMLKIREPVKILSIVPGTKYLGTSLFYGSELRDWGIKVLNEKGTDGKVKKVKDIISDFIERYEPQVLAVKKLDLKKSSKNLNSLVRKSPSVLPSGSLSACKTMSSFFPKRSRIC